MPSAFLSLPKTGRTLNLTHSRKSFWFHYPLTFTTRNQRQAIICCLMTLASSIRWDDINITPDHTNHADSHIHWFTVIGFLLLAEENMGEWSVCGHIEREKKRDGDKEEERPTSRWVECWRDKEKKKRWTWEGGIGERIRAQ